jgi:hypothetical protein
MEHTFAAEHARAMKHLDRADSHNASVPLMRGSAHAEVPPPKPRVSGRKCRVPESVLNPSGPGSCLDRGEGSSRREEVKRNLNPYVSDEAEELSTTIGQDVSIAHKAASPSEQAPQPLTSERPERLPTPFPFAKGQFTKRQGKQPIDSSSENGKSKFNTSPGRLERVPSTIYSVHASSPPRPSSVKEGKDNDKAIDLPSPQEVDAWRLESNASNASSLHPGFRHALTPRYSPLHKGSTDLRLPNIDSVLSNTSSPHPSSPGLSLSQFPLPPNALRYADFFATPVEPRSPVDKTGHGNASPADTERFNNLPEYTGDSPPYERARPKWAATAPPVHGPGMRVEVASLYREGFLEGEIEWRQRTAEERRRAEQERVRECLRAKGARGFVGRVKGLLRKMRAVGGGEGRMVEGRKKKVLAGMKSRVSRTGVSVGKLFGTVREG